MKLTLLVLATLGLAAGKYHCCTAGEPEFLGTYTEDGENDGAPKYTNAKSRSIFRNNGFWYMGDLSGWPPETYYRCVEGCASGASSPPLEGYQATKTRGVAQAPILSTEECTHDEL